MNLKSLFVSFVLLGPLLLLSFLGWTLPRPLSLEQGQFVSPTLGFQISAGQSGWRLEAPPESLPSIVTIFKSPQPQTGLPATATVRVDHLESPLTLAQYVRRWMQDYHRFGFDILQNQPIRVEGQEAFLLDLLHREEERQLRQIVFVKEKTAVILTCRDQQSNFNQSLPACNEIARQFRWLSSSAQ